MRYGLLIFGATAFLIANIYNDGKYVTLLKSWKKYYQMAFIGFLGLSAYLFIRKHPTHSKNLFVHANDLIKYMHKNNIDIPIIIQSANPKCVHEYNDVNEDYVEKPIKFNVLYRKMNHFLSKIII